MLPPSHLERLTGPGDALPPPRRRRTLGARWREVLDGDRPSPLPGRADLERRFGRSLGHVATRSGPAARSLLTHLGARAATAGDVVLLRDPADRATIAHEVVHVLQRAAGSGEHVGGVVRADHPAEVEAETLARARRDDGSPRAGGSGRPPVTVRARLPVGAIALRRDRDLPILDDEALAEADAGRDPVTPSPPRLLRRQGRVGGDPGANDRRADEQSPEAPAPETPEPSDGAEPGGAPEAPTEEGADEQPGVATAPLGVEAAAPEGGPRRGAAGAGGAATGGPDRQEEVRDVLADTQRAWDRGKQAAEDADIDPCGELTAPEGHQPFARGPPLDVPSTSPVPEVPDVQPGPVDEAALVRARHGVEERLGWAPARAPPGAASGLDADERAERDAARRRLTGRIDEGMRQAPDTTTQTPTVDLTGRADPERIERATERADAASADERDAARERAGEDFGEERLAPAIDPADGHETALTDASIPAVDVQAGIDRSRLRRIGTAGNAGQLPLDEVVLVRDRDLAATRRMSRRQELHRRRVDQELRRGDRALDESCEQEQARREQHLQRASNEVAGRRTRWTRAVDEHVSGRRREADGLATGARRRTERIATNADDRAQRTVQDADRQAERRWAETRQRAEAKAGEAEDRGWFQRGLDWVRERINQLVEWIDGFIEACRRAIDALLETARQVAHAVVDGAHRAISGVLDGLHAAVDVIADNLPGELGEIARGYRDDVHQALDAAQERLDGWAAVAHEQIDTTIDGVRDAVHSGLDELQQGVHDVADAVDDFLANGLMAFLEANSPRLAALLKGRLAGPVEEAAGFLEGWATTLLERTGVGRIADTLKQIRATRFCEAPSPEEQADACEALQADLESARAWVDDLLASPAAQAVQDYLAEQARQEAEAEAEAVSGFFSFIAAVASPVYEWWQSVRPDVEAALDELGEIAGAIWRHIAIALGIDPDLPPLEALVQGLEAAWETVSETVAPLVDRLREAWDWLRNRSPLAPVFEFFASLPQLWDALSAAVSELAGDLVDWLVERGQQLADLVMRPLQAAASAVASLVERLLDVVAAAVDGLLGVLDAVIGWEPALALVAAAAAVVGKLLTPAREALQLFRDCAIPAWRAMAGMLRDLGTLLRNLIDLAIGLSFAIAGFPVTMTLFLAGRVWRHLVPECAKGPLIDFVLDLGIRFLRFLPEPTDFGLVIVRSGLLGFLEGLRAAPTEQKVGAVDLFARMVGGDVETAAGFAVGLLEGVWESTGGTVIFLLQAVAWLLALPVKLVRWADEQAHGAGPGAGGPAATGRRTRAPPLAVGAVAGIVDVPTPGEETSELGRLRLGAGGARGPHVMGSEGPRSGAEPAWEESTPTEEPAAAPELTETELRTVRMDVRGQGVARDSEAPMARNGEVVPGTDATVGRGSDVDFAPPVRDGVPAAAAAGRETSAPEPPGVPATLANAPNVLERLLTTGFTRQEIADAIAQLRATLRGVVGGLARQAAGMMLEALNAPGAGYEIARTMGSLVGQVVVEVALAALTGGASGFITAAKVAMQGARVTARLAGVIARLRRVLDPLLSALARLKRALAGLGTSLRRWLDNVLEWMRGIMRRFIGRGRLPRPGRPRPRRPRRRGTPSRDRTPDRPRDRTTDRRRGGDRRDRRRDRDRDRDDNDRSRLQRAVRAIRPSVTRLLRRGVSRWTLSARLTAWRLRYRLRRLRIDDRAGDRVVVEAANSPPQVVVSGVSPEGAALLRIVREEVDRYFASRVPERERDRPWRTGEGTQSRPFDLRGVAGASPVTAYEAAMRQRAVTGRMPRLWAREAVVIGERVLPAGRGRVPVPSLRQQMFGRVTGGSVQLLRPGGATERLGTYGDIGQRFRGLVSSGAVTPRDLMHEIESLTAEARVSHAARAFAPELASYVHLLGEETVREPAAAVFARAPHLEMGRLPTSEAGAIPGLFEGPHTPRGAAAHARGVRAELGVPQQPVGPQGATYAPGGTATQRGDYRRREVAAYHRVLAELRVNPRLALDQASFRAEIVDVIRSIYG